MKKPCGIDWFNCRKAKRKIGKKKPETYQFHFTATGIQNNNNNNKKGEGEEKQKAKRKVKKQNGAENWNKKEQNKN